MSVFTTFNLKISAENGDELKKAMLVIQSQIERKKAWDCITTKDIFDKITKLHVFEMEFDPWSLPFEMYEELKAIEGISIVATKFSDRNHYHTRYRSTAEGRSLMEVETDLNDWGSDYQVVQEHLKWKISDLQMQRDNLDLAIDALQTLGAPASEDVIFS